MLPYPPAIASWLSPTVSVPWEGVHLGLYLRPSLAIAKLLPHLHEPLRWYKTDMSCRCGINYFPSLLLCVCRYLSVSLFFVCLLVSLILYLALCICLLCLPFFLRFCISVFRTIGAIQSAFPRLLAPFLPVFFLFFVIYPLSC